MDQTILAQALRAHERVMALAKTDDELRALIPLDAVSDAMSAAGLADDEIVAIALEGYAPRPAFAIRRYEIEHDPATGRRTRRYLSAFGTVSYAEVRKRVEALASAWRHHDRHYLRPGDFLCIFGFTGADYAISDLAGVYSRSVVVPLQANLAQAELGRIIDETAAPVLVSTVDSLATVALLAARAAKVRGIVVIDFDARDDDDRDRFEAARGVLAGSPVALTTLDDLVAFGKDLAWTPAPRSEEGEQRVAALIFSSGSTGTPKGAMLPEAATKSIWTGAGKRTPTVTVGYLPMNHIAGRDVVFRTLSVGGTIYFSLRSDMSTLFQDIRLARPTTLGFIPRVADLVHQHYQSEIVRRATASAGDRDVVAGEVMAEMRAGFLGDRLCSGSVGSAPTAPEVKRFLRKCFDMFFVDGYASTEGGGVITLGDRIVRSVVTDYRLRDVPALGYTGHDEPHPRGELLIRSKTQIRGYFNNPELNAALFDEDGFLATGDIVEEHGPDHVVWIDRKNSVLKLAQGEYVALGPLETTFSSGSPLIRQIYLYGNSYRAFLLAVVVPDMAVAAAMSGGVPDEAALHALVRATLQEVAGEAGLKAFETPRDVLVEAEAFSPENGLLSSVGKPLMPKLKQRYGERLEALYDLIELRQRGDLEAIKRGDVEMTTLERVGKVLEASLGITNLDPSLDRSFGELGGDSLGAVSFALLIEDVFGIEIAVDTILSPAGSPKHWADAIDRARRQEGTRPAPSHGPSANGEARRLRAADLVLETLVDIEAAPGAAARLATERTRTVLLTGASGHLGRFLCLDWLEQVAKEGGRVVCLIRAPDADVARTRLDRSFASDPELAARFRALAERHLEVIVGDLGQPNLGLDHAIFERLADEVDHVVHAAAMVNHRLSYSHLFQPNVLGTAELIRFALLRRLKRFDYVSSVAVLHLPGPPMTGEDEDIRVGRPEIEITEGYANGYGASKWAGEVLLRDAHDRFGLPVNVFRADMILAHSRFHGQINSADMFTRLIYSVLVTATAPDCFYEGGPGGAATRAHYNGLPVDFVAGALAQIGVRARNGFHTYNVVNSHEGDGISLDRIVDWMVAAGYPIDRSRSYPQWARHMEKGLRALPEQSRQHSLLPLMSAFEHPQKATGSQVPAADFAAMVRDLPIGPEIPHLSEEFIRKCLGDLQTIGLIPMDQTEARVA